MDSSGLFLSLRYPYETKMGTVSNFLYNVWRDGALQGAIPEEAFFVRCDRPTTMTQTDIDNGKLIMEIGIAPVKPAEFIIFRIFQWFGGGPESGEESGESSAEASEG